MNKVAKDPARGKQAPDTSGQRATKPVQSTLYEINNLKENMRRINKVCTISNVFPPSFNILNDLLLLPKQ